MKKRYPVYFVLAALMALLSPSWVKSQGLPCGSDQARQRLIQQHPEILMNEKALEDYTQKFVADYMKRNGSRSSDTGDAIIIPMVFHIIEQGGVENITDAQVINEVAILNRDYNLHNTDTSQVIVQPLKDVIGNMHLQFALASLDPDGNCTTGIEHIYSVQTYSGDDYSKLNTWPRQNYINIWLVAHLGGNAAGYAYYPADVASVYNIPAQDGVIILYDYIGSIGTSSNLTSRALTHELGHCFNLKHCWGDTNLPGVACGDDDVADTPITKGWDSCPGTDTGAAKICNPPIIENFQNYMEYSYCSVMFTKGQVARAIAALSDTVAQRNNLWTQANLIATGVIDTAGGVTVIDTLSNAHPCKPIAAFSPSARYGCLDGYITLNDNSYNGTVNSWSWNIPNGAPNTSTDQNPKIQFIEPGWQPIQLIVTNSFGSDTINNNQLVYIGYNNTLYEAPYYEGFDDPNVFNDPSQWASVNYDENQTFFAPSNYPHTGTGSAVLNNYFATANHDIDEIVSPPIDLTPLALEQMNISFYYSWASGNQDYNSNGDSIAVFGSNDCGVTWKWLWAENATAVLGYWQGYWTPTTESGVWQKVNIPLSNSTVYNEFHKTNVRFKIDVFSSVGGNNFYIDDFNVGDAATPTGIIEQSAINNVTLFPNPSNGQFNLDVQLAQSSKASVKVLDITGKEVIDAFEGQMNEGDNQMQLNSTEQLAKGIYIVYIQAGGSTLQRKLVIQ